MEKPNLSAAAVSRPLETSYRDEFYASCYRLLGNSYLTPESTGPNVSAWVDFRVKNQGRVIECMRDGSKLNEHIARFKPDGRYYPWILSGEVREYILLDFHTSVPCKARSKFTPVPNERL